MKMNIMPDNFSRILIAVSERSNIIKNMETGKSPEDLKNAIIDTFYPFFENKNNLKKSASTLLISDFHEFLIIRKTDFYPFFLSCLDTYKRAKLLESNLCIEGITLFEPQMTEATGRFWSVFFSQQDLNHLSDDDYLFECLKNIGSIIEGISKPFLKSLLFQIKITIGEKPNFKEIDDMSLGDVIVNLINNSGYPELFFPKPKKIRLNHWRNISYHHTASINKSIITCIYGSKKKYSISLTKKELAETVINILFILRTIRLANNIFSTDNIQDLLKHSQDSPSEGRKEIEFENYVLAIMAQGFHVIDFSYDENKTLVKIRDVLEKEEDDRRIARACMFLVAFWLLTNSKTIEIECQIKHQNFLLSIDGSDCQKLDSGEFTISNYLDKIKIVSIGKK